MSGQISKLVVLNLKEVAVYERAGQIYVAPWECPFIHFSLEIKIEDADPYEWWNLETDEEGEKLLHETFTDIQKLIGANID